jgi:hypothetical protein
MSGNGARCANLQICKRRLRKGQDPNSVFAFSVFLHSAFVLSIFVHSVFALSVLALSVFALSVFALDVDGAASTSY